VRWTAWGRLIGRSYRLFRYSGHPEADRVVVVIGSAFEVLDETAAWLNAHGEKVGVLHVTLYRPWDAERFRAALPSTVTRIAVLDRTKEIGGPGEPLYLDVLTTFAEGARLGPHLVHARDRGRTLRPVVEGLRPRDGQDGLRRAEEAGAEARVHDRDHR
jgi:pyruvate/2-oxoacid:ferredoxin oxidoreductase alpha subunit